MSDTIPTYGDLRYGQEVAIVASNETRGIPPRGLVTGIQGRLFPEAALDPLVIVEAGGREWKIPLRLIRIL